MNTEVDVDQEQTDCRMASFNARNTSECFPKLGQFSDWSDNDARSNRQFDWSEIVVARMGSEVKRYE
jgi:hypothetical protein